MAIDFPVGIHAFSKNKIVNFELNRWNAFGLARLEDLIEAAQSIKTIEDNKAAFWQQAKKAEAEGRLANAAIYYRAAEFYVPPQDPDKALLYDKFADCFYRACEKDDIERLKIPYQSSYLHGLRLCPSTDEIRGAF